MGCDSRVSRRSLLAALTAAPAFRAILAQQNSGTTFSTDVKVVSLFATVRDKKGQIVTDLTKDDFVLDEDGQPQTIRYFERESNLPLTVGLLVDTSGSQRRVLPDERDASYRFFQQVLREDRDMAFVIHFDREVELLQDLTSSRALLEKALQLLEVPEEQRPQLNRRGQYPGGSYPGGGQYPGGGRYPGGSRGGRGGGAASTSLYDALWLAANDMMKKQSGRKAVIILSDGVDTSSKESLETAVEAAQRADTLAYSVLFSDSEGYSGGFGPMIGRGMGRRGGMGGGRGPVIYDRPDGKKVLERISRETGGRFFEVTRKQSISDVYAAIEEDLRNQYSLGYAPQRQDAGAGYRLIHLTTKRKGLIVQTREGYYAS